ncbi:MAG: hypothetical protein IK055_01245 [Lachnospiraceae bacterium]|nr:hypothetical protein [Lachnospiraceae bacterium]
MSSKDKWTIARRNVAAGKSSGIKIIIGFALCFFLLFCMLIIGLFYRDYTREFEGKNRKQCYFYSEIRAKTFAELDEELVRKRAWSEACGAENAAVMVSFRIAEDTLVQLRDAAWEMDGVTYTAGRFTTGRRTYYEDLTSSMAALDFALFESETDWCGNLKTELVYGRWPEQEGELLADEYLLGVFGITPAEAVGKTVTIRAKGEAVLAEYVVSGVAPASLLKERECEDYDLANYHVEHLYVHLRGQDKENLVVGRSSIRYYYSNVKDFTGHYEFSGKLTDGTVIRTADGEQKLSMTGKGMMICLLTFFTGRFGRILLGLGVGICAVTMLSLLYVRWFYLQRNKRYMTMLECIGMDRDNRRSLRRRELVILGGIALAAALYLTLLFYLVFRYFAEKALEFRCSFHFGVFAIVIAAGAAMFLLLSDAVVRKYDESVSI